MSKKELGQYYTTNYKYILKDLEIPKGVKIIEPFVGNGDLLKFTSNKVECFDINPNLNLEYTIRDTLLNPPIYKNKFVLTNPPYLAKNKSKDKTLFNKYKTDDLYKCFLISLIEGDCIGGIIIIPVNFISSKDNKLRKRFLQKYKIIKINIFEEKVFDDTSYSVCSLLFSKDIDDGDIDITIYPSKQKLKVNLNKDNDYTIGGEIFKLKKNKEYKIERATRLNPETKISNIFLKCIDDRQQLGFKIVEDNEKYIDNTKNLSCRSYASLVITPSISLEKQKELVEKCNKYIFQMRDKYNSLFLTNYREAKRKRISFELAFRIVNYFI